MHLLKLQRLVICLAKVFTLLTWLASLLLTVARSSPIELEYSWCARWPWEMQGNCTPPTAMLMSCPRDLTALMEWEPTCPTLRKSRLFSEMSLSPWVKLWQEETNRLGEGTMSSLYTIRTRLRCATSVWWISRIDDYSNS